MNEQRKVFEVHVRSECDSAEYADSILEKNKGGFYHVTRIQGMWEGWQAAIASQAPRQALSDAEIGKAVQKGYSKNDGIRMDQADLQNIIIELGAIEAASGSNAALVEALKSLLKWSESAENTFRQDFGVSGGEPDEIVAARAALAAVGEEP